MPSAEGTGAGKHPGAVASDLPRFQTGPEVVLHRGRFITVTRAAFVDPDGHPFERDVVRHPGAVAMVAVTEAEAVLLVQQYRPAVDRWLLEVPAGTCDIEGEPVETTARRELAEELGYAAGRWRLLTRCAITPGFCDEYSSVYLCTDLSAVPVDRQGTEERFMRVAEVPLDRFDALVDDGTIVDATTILGVALARRYLSTTG